MKCESIKLVIDTREQCPLVFEHLPWERGTLDTGDYSVKGLENRFSVERKSISDLVGSLTSGRERFERECHRLRGFDFARLLVVGNPACLEMELTRRKTSARAILGSLGAIEVRYRLPVVWCDSAEQGARLVEKWAWYAYREAWRPFKEATPPCDGLASAVVKG